MTQNFIHDFIDEDIRPGWSVPSIDPSTPGSRPEPNGYLHIGHAKSICLNFGLARDYGGACHMRFDDTNPVKEDQEYVDGIMDSVRWLGFDWKFGNETNLYFASSYFDDMFRFAEHLDPHGLCLCG